ncbi:hypothetical protein JCM10207_007528 [Rhodosporidiobolus poonsookiae]
MDDYFSFPPLKHEDLSGAGDGLLTPAEVAGYLSPLDSPVSSTLSSRLQEAASLSIADEDTEGSATDGEGSATEGEESAAPSALAASKRSPSALVAVLHEGASPPPPPQARFLHGGPPLSDLEAPSVVMPQPDKRNRPIASSEWRAFTDEEELRLQEAWQKLQQERKAGKARGRCEDKGVFTGDHGLKRAAEDEAGDEDAPYIVPVGLDNLFSVHLRNHILYPAFWTGTPVRVILSHWFYAPPNSATIAPSHQLKPFPVDPSLSSALDKAYSSIRPYDSSYEAELASALKGGTEAQRRLAVALAVENEAEAGGNRMLGIEVIFEGKNRGRVYSKGTLGSLSKSLWSSGKGLGGGQVVLRGWDALREYLQDKAQKKAPSADSPHKRTDSASSIASPRSASPAGRTRTSSASSASAGASIKRADSPGFFSSLRNRIVGPAQPSDDAAAGAEGAASTSALPNDTQDALEREPRGEDSKVGAVDELVLIVHGIGQQLATSYDSFAFTHAANAFRSVCTSLSTSDTLSPLLKGKRAQVIPVLWRSDLDFDQLDDSEETADEMLDNRFGLSDIEVQGSVPILRQIVSGLVLDVPFYLSPAHKEKMLRSVVREANRIYRLFCKRNPSFTGKVSIIAHSLGSCLVADILSNQPTFVKDLEKKPSLCAKHDPALTFAFDTRVVFLVGSPLAFFLHLSGKGQLIARAGRERTKNVGKEIALDRAGRYGCLAADTVYNVYHEVDPVVFTLNAAVDARYAKLIKPVPIPSTTQTLLQNLSDAYTRVSRIFDWSSLWSGGGAQNTDEQAKEQAEKQEEEKKDKVDEPVKAQRPAGLKRMPTERAKYGMGKDEFEWVTRAEKRMRALNPSGTIDYVLPAEGLNQYVDALWSHQSYWTDRRFSTFFLSQLFADDQELERAGRNEIGVVPDEEDEEGE